MPARPGRGSPTARRWSPPRARGKGLIVLFHVTADTTWSNLPMSGLFVDMLRRVVARAGAGAGRGERRREGGRRRRRARPIAPSTASASLGAPAGRSRADRRRFRRPGRRAPSARLLRPGRRARSGQRAGAGRGAGAGRLSAPVTIAAGGLDVAEPLDLKPWLLLAALLGFLADGLASLWLGRPPRFAQPGRRGAARSSARSPARRSLAPQARAADAARFRPATPTRRARPISPMS